MNDIRKPRMLLWASVAAYGIMALGLAVIVFEELGHVPGILFWIGLIAGSVLQTMVSACRRRFYGSWKIVPNRVKKHGIGLLSVCSCREGKVADLLLLAGIAASALSIWLRRGRGVLCYIFIAAAVFFLCLHCIFNGKNWHFVRNYGKIKEYLEKKNGNTQEKGEGER